MPPSSSSPARRSGNPPPHRGGGTGPSSANRPLYAIDFTAVACGKRIANTKRRVRWRFGFANPDAIAAGETGTACRGEEHDVTFVWSVTSGKRLILADGQEVHYSSSRSAVIDFSWTMRGNHVLKVVAHATAPMTAEPGFRQYDFFVDGRSFFTFPKVYRLGLTPGTSSGGRQQGQMSSSGGGSSPPPPRGAVGSARRSESGDIAQIEAPHNPDEEEAYLREAIKASLMESRQNEGKSVEKPKISAEATDLLIDFMDDWDSGRNSAPVAAIANGGVGGGGGNEWAMVPASSQQLGAGQWSAQPPPAWAAPVQPTPDNNYGWAAPSPLPGQQPPAQPAQQQQQPDYGGGGMFGGGGGYAPATSDPWAPPPVPNPPPQQQQQQHYQQGLAAAPVAPPAPAAADPFLPSTSYGQSDPFAPPPASTTSDYAGLTPADGGQPAGNNVVLTMGNLDASTGLLAGTSSASGGGGGGGGGTMAERALQNLMGSIDSFGLTGKAATANNPFDSTSNVMSNATLGEIKISKAAEKKPVMNAPPGPGALVMANNQGGNWGGFGAGAGGQQQQQSQYNSGMGGSMMQGQQAVPPQYSMLGGYPQQQQQPPQMGMQQPQMMGMQQPQMMGMMQQPQMGMMQGQQPPMQQQGYGAPPPYGQQPPMQQQNQWGAPYY